MVSTYCQLSPLTLHDHDVTTTTTKLSLK